LSDTPTALLAKGKLVLSVPKAREARDLLRAGAVKGMSIGYKTVKADFDQKGFRHLKELKLYEGSLVTLPMNDQAVVTAVKQQPAVISSESALVRRLEEMRRLLIWPEAPHARLLRAIDRVKRSLKA
jgi:phage head maturation protease